MPSQQDHPLGDLLTLPFLLIVALAVWAVSFISGKPAHR